MTYPEMTETHSLDDSVDAKPSPTSLKKKTHVLLEVSISFKLLPHFPHIILGGFTMFYSFLLTFVLLLFRPARFSYSYS